MDNHNMPPGFVEACIMWLKINSPTLYGVFAAFGMAALITLRDGNGWRDCFYAGAISGLIGLGVINSLEMFGMSQANAVTVGVIVGGMGVERCLAIIRMVASMKTNTPLDEKDRKDGQ